MGRSHPHRAPVVPVPDDTPRPLWSVMIPTYHCAAYLREALASVLVQDPGPEVMQIEVVDDASTADDPEAVVRSVGGSRVGFVRQPRNVGVVRNFATCLQRARGRLVHLLHGDDLVLPGFYAAMQQAFEVAPEVGAAFCRHIYMDEDGHWQGLAPLEQRTSGVLPDALERLATEQRIMTPAIVVKREVYETLGGFDERLPCSEDWEMWVRIAARYPVWYEVRPLAVYRMHTASNTGRHLAGAAHLRYTRRAIDLFRDYLPPDRAEPWTQRARTAYGLSAVALAARFARQGDGALARAHAREALALSRAWPVLWALARLGVRAAIGRARRAIGRPQGRAVGGPRGGAAREATSAGGAHRQP